MNDIADMAIRVNDFMCGMFAAIGIRLVDFKLEFGRVWDSDYRPRHPRRRDQPRRLPAVGHEDQREARQGPLPPATSAARPKPIRKSPAGSACCPRKARKPPSSTSTATARSAASSASAAEHRCSALPRVRVVTLNAALGPLDYRVPDGMAVEPGSVVVAPLGPRQLVGVAWEAERLPDRGSRRQPPAAARRRWSTSRRSPRRCAASPNGPPTITSRPLAAVLRMVLPSSAALDGPRQLIEYRPTGARPRPPDPAARAGARRARRPAGHDPRARRPCRGQRRGDARAGQRRRARSGRGRRRPAARPPRSRFRAARRSTTSSARPRPASTAAIGKGFDPVLLDGVTGSGKTEVYFEAIAEALRQGKQALVLLPEIALTEPFLKRFTGALRLRAGRLASRPALVAAPPRLAGDRQRRGARSWSAPARRCSCPIRNLGLIVVDEAHEPSFKQEEGVQYHARDVAVMRGQFEDIPVILVLGDPGDRDPAHGRDRPLSRSCS